jgi:hypothetical protein
MLPRWAFVPKPRIREMKDKMKGNWPTKMKGNGNHSPNIKTGAGGNFDQSICDKEGMMGVATSKSMPKNAS